jgi:hypothetical protein
MARCNSKVTSGNTFLVFELEKNDQASIYVLLEIKKSPYRRHHGLLERKSDNVFPPTMDVTPKSHLATVSF